MADDLENSVSADLPDVSADEAKDNGGDEKTEKGEYCIVFDLRQVPKIVEKPQADISLEAQLVEAMLKSDCGLRDASRALIEEGSKKNAVYAASLRLKKLFEEE